MTPNLPLRELAVELVTVAGIQIDVQAPVQSTLPLISWSGVYSARPLASTRTLPELPMCFTDTTLVPVTAVPPALDDDPPLLPHAASAMLAATAARVISSPFIDDLRWLYDVPLHPVQTPIGRDPSRRLMRAPRRLDP